MAQPKNPLKAALARGEAQVGTWLNLVRNPAVLVLIKAAGLDYARVDMEHSSPSIETVADMAVLSRALQFPLVVRPPAGNREWITRLLDVGVLGLHIPQVDTPEAARSVVEAARYAPLGMRGMAGGGPHNAQAFEHLDEIVATPGIDAVTLGPSDLAQELGVLGTPDEGRVIDQHRERLLAAARRHGRTGAGGTSAG
jgi:2-keto-3-deoxy-L-rhamnonate aldolase RhmA